MSLRKQPGYAILLTLTVIFTLLAVITLIPSPNASKECLLGYKAHCSFTPIGTIICLVASGVTCILRKRLFVK